MKFPVALVSSPRDFDSLSALSPAATPTLSPLTDGATATIALVDSSIRKLLKGGRDLYDSLIAAIIRNLKIVKNPYVVQGGFQSWMKQGIRIKELKSETALSILNECLEETEDLSIEVGAKSDKAVTTTLLIDSKTSNSTPAISFF
ncbi:hypothetical protein Fmac_025304 [Flemingia macrophylla]|uniref:Uncharacterized protein n=1 Tax=Flemingia macrophylla TaxID=520843 RepID=A0ABD1LRU6_9FABA